MFGLEKVSTDERPAVSTTGEGSSEATASHKCAAVLRQALIAGS